MTEVKKSYNGLTEVTETLPADYYLEPVHHERELNAIWYRHWVYVGRAESFDGSRAFRTIDIGSQSILIVRDENGELQAFHNTCRHRGSVLCTEHEGRLRSKSIICPYHNWTYSLQGDLQRTPSKHLQADFNKQDYPLYAVAVDEWKGFVFVNLAGQDAAPLVDSFHEDSANFDNWPMNELMLGHSYTKTMACNWKIFWENFNECLHCPSVHPELSKMVPIYSRAYMEPQDDPNWQQHQDSPDPKLTGGMREGAQTWTFDGQPVGKPFDGLTESEQKTGYHYVVNQPSVFIAAHIDYVRIVRLLPLGVDQTELHIEWLFSEETLADKTIDIEKAAGFAKLVMQQDAFVSELNQKGLRSIAHKKGVLMPEEYDVYNFQNWVRRQLANG
jgi:Rieske 2Fe-2S family protein